MREPTQRQDAFPETRRTWMGQLLDHGEVDTARHHIMQTYAEPLRIYCRGCSLRWVGEPADLVAGFFADRLSRPAFLLRWQESGRALRFWLIVGFKHYMLEQARQKRRGKHLPPIEEGLDVGGAEPDRAFDRSCAVELVRQALNQTAEACRRDGLSEHWEIFTLFHLRSVPLDRIAADRGLGVARASVMKRTAARRFRSTFRELVSWHHADDELIDAEIRDLRGVIR